MPTMLPLLLLAGVVLGGRSIPSQSQAIGGKSNEEGVQVGGAALQFCKPPELGPVSQSIDQNQSRG